MKVHDVRHLCVCKGCGSLGDGREMPRVEGSKFHDACAFKIIGIDGVLSLPEPEINKFSIGAIGVKAMTRLIDEMAKRKPQSPLSDHQS